MTVTYLVCYYRRTEKKGFFGFFGHDVTWDQPRGPSECVWLVPGTECDE